MEREDTGSGEVQGRLGELRREKEALLDRLDGERRRTAALGRALEMVEKLKDRQRLLDSTLEGAAELTGAEAGSIIMVSQEDPAMLKFESAKGERAAELSEHTFRVGEGIAGWVVEQGIAQIIPDAGKDARFLASLANQIGYRVSNILCVPLRKSGVVVGALQLLNKSGGRRFNALDVEVAETLASQAGRLLQVGENLAVGRD